MAKSKNKKYSTSTLVWTFLGVNIVTGVLANTIISLTEKKPQTVQGLRGCNNYNPERY